MLSLSETLRLCYTGLNCPNVTILLLKAVQSSSVLSLSELWKPHIDAYTPATERELLLSPPLLPPLTED